MPANNKKTKKVKTRVADIVVKAQPLLIKKAVKIEKPKTDEHLLKEEARASEAADVSEFQMGKIGEALHSLEEMPELSQPHVIEEQVEKFESKEVERFTEEEKTKRRKRFTIKTYFLVGFLVILLGATAYAAVEFLPKAKIKIVTKKFDWRFVDSVVATKKITTIDTASKSIPAEVFSERKNFTFSFSATGKKAVERKATGKITIYNAYSSDKQPLVASTRFSAPDGKIFRLEKSITVPGAKIVDGKIVPSSIEATVAADKAGTDYNIGPINKFYIPGFKGSPRYEAFYASSAEAMKGGFVGELPFPTDADIQKSKEEAEKSLRDNIDSFLYLDISPAFKVIDGSKQFDILKEEVNKDVNENGNFTIFLDAQSSIIAFKEADLLSLLTELAQNDLRPQTNGSETFVIKDYKIDYGNGRLDLNQGQISFAPTISAAFWQPINAEDFKQKSLNKKEDNLRALIYSLPTVEKATISFWPFWVKTVPKDIKRVTVEVE